MVCKGAAVSSRIKLVMTAVIELNPAISSPVQFTKHISETYL